ncbi:hypothetical protein [Enterobacter cancerogenus]|uniref:hypothetical protein n=1 Tax=Enterobacter cancerogenus TaxID=69218 RepID=UPI004058799A
MSQGIDDTQFYNWTFIRQMQKTKDSKKVSMTVYKIMNVKTQRCLTLSSLHSPYLVASDCSSDNDNLWIFSPLKSGAIQLFNLSAHACLKSVNEKGNDNAGVVRFSDCGSGPYINKELTWSFSASRGDSVVINY